jgi:hypothetical protein
VNVNNDDIRAFGAEPAATAANTAPRRRARWPWVLGAALLLMVLLLAAGTVAAWAALTGVVNEGISIVVDGHRWDDLLPEHAWAAVVSLGLTGALIVGALLMCVGLLVPLVLSLALLIVGLVVAVALAAVGVALAVALSPLWLPLLLLWLLLRPSRPPLASSSA